MPNVVVLLKHYFAHKIPLLVAAKLLHTVVGVCYNRIDAVDALDILRTAAKIWVLVGVVVTHFHVVEIAVRSTKQRGPLFAAYT